MAMSKTKGRQLDDRASSMGLEDRVARGQELTHCHPAAPARHPAEPRDVGLEEGQDEPRAWGNSVIVLSRYSTHVK